MQAAQRIADIVALLETLPPAERRRIVRVISAAPLTVSLDRAPLPPADAARADLARATIFGSMLQRFLDDGHPAIVQVHMRQDDRAGHGMPPWKGGGASMQPPRGAGPAFVAQVRLRDGTLVTFDSDQPTQTASWPYRLLLSLAVLLVAVVAVSLVAVRWATRPLDALADAADALGRDIAGPPMREEGPREVVRAARAFNTMQTRIARLVGERTAMVAAMSHDLKTPLTRLRLRAELLADGEVKEKISGDVSEMEALVHASLEFMRGIDASEATQPIDVGALLESLRADAAEAGHAVTLERATAAPGIERATAPYAGKPQALKRCIGNLVDNAVKYAGAATIVVDDSPARLVVRIADKGPGIPEAELDRVFEPFHRIEGSRNRSTGGTGLGLGIARDIARLHGGTLVLRNLAPGGLEAVLTLPRGGTPEGDSPD